MQIAIRLPRLWVPLTAMQNRTILSVKDRWTTRERVSVPFSTRRLPILRSLVWEDVMRSLRIRLKKKQTPLEQSQLMEDVRTCICVVRSQVTNS